jgi:hypothetical protein
MVDEALRSYPIGEAIEGNPTMDVRRVSVREAHRRMSHEPGLLLVCAYDTEERFREMELEGALSWPAFQARLSSLPKEQEIVLYCA